MDALLAAGEQLAEAMRTALAARGLPSDLCVMVDGGRVVVASRSAAVRRAELGEPGIAPGAAMEGAAREAAPLLVHALAGRLEGFLG